MGCVPFPRYELLSTQYGRVHVGIRILLEYCKVEQNKTPDIATPSSRRDHRKSKFGPRHGVKLIELYGVTKSEF
jgi:hypothetical protein